MADKQRVGRFLRTLLGVLLVAWLVAALAAPPDPFTFLLYLVPAWVVGTAVAAWLVFADGYAVLASSGLYAPRTSASRATAAFAVLVVVLKLLATFGADLVLGAATVGYAVGLAGSAVALLGAYVVVFVVGLPGRLFQRDRTTERG